MNYCLPTQQGGAVQYIQQDQEAFIRIKDNNYSCRVHVSLLSKQFAMKIFANVAWGLLSKWNKSESMTIQMVHH